MLLINLHGLFQSYGGAGAVSGVRRSLGIPTLSAVTSMIAVAGGFGSDYARIDDLCAQLHMDIAVLQSGWVIEDFQTVTGSRSSDGDLLKKTIVSPRQYIANAY